MSFMSQGWRARMKHAFAVDPSGPAEPTAEQQPAVDWVCTQIAKRHLTTPGLIFLEMSRPLNFIGAQTMHFFAPFVSALLSEQGHAAYVHFSTFLEHRGSMDYIMRRIEHFESQFEKQAQQPKGGPPDSTTQ